MIWRCYLALLVCLWPFMAHGQPTEVTDGNAPDSEATGESPATDDAGAEDEAGGEEPQVPGDVITLTTGNKLTGVQILRRTPKTLEIEIIEGEAPLSISMKLVEDIQWDDIDPIKMRRERETAKLHQQDNILEGQKLLPEFLNKLNAPISEVEIPVDDKNFVKIIRELAQKVNIEITVTEGIKNIPPDQRAWKTLVPPNASLQDVFSNLLLTAFPTIRVNYAYDKVELALKTEEDTSGAPPVPAPEPPPAALPNGLKLPSPADSPE